MQDIPLSRLHRVYGPSSGDGAIQGLNALLQRQAELLGLKAIAAVSAPAPNIVASPFHVQLEARTHETCAGSTTPTTTSELANDATTAAHHLMSIFEVISLKVYGDVYSANDLRIMFLAFNEGRPIADPTEEWKLVFGMAAVVFHRDLVVVFNAKRHEFSFLGHVTTTGAATAGAASGTPPPPSGDVWVFEGVDYPEQASGSSLETFFKKRLEPMVELVEGDVQKAERLFALFAPLGGRGDNDMYFVEGESEDTVRGRAKAFAQSIIKQRTSAPEDATPLTIFVHGFNNTDADATARADALCLSLGTPVTPFLWPSAGHWYSYWRDQAVAGVAAKYLSTFVSEIAQHPTAIPALRIVAHSMGNYATVLGLLDMPTSGVTVPLLRVVSAAADVAPTELLNAVARVSNWTSYYCEGDRVLQMSELLNRSSRAGLSSLGSNAVSSVRVPNDSGHSYIDVKGALNDISAVLRSVPVQDRVNVAAEGDHLTLSW